MARRSLMPFNFRRDLEPFNWLRREMDDLFDHFWRSSRLRPFSDREFLLAPDVDVSETDNEVIVVADLPGLEEKDINIEMSNNMLRISGEKKIDREEKGKNFHRIERISRSFNRSIQIPADINNDNVQANFKNGVLTVTLPKSEEARAQAKRIEVKKG